MAFPNHFIRQTMMWQLPQGENASCTFGWDPGGASVLTDALADALAARAGAWWATWRTSWPNSVLFIGSRISMYDAGGAVTMTRERFVDPDPGGQTGGTLPTEVSVCVSLITALAGRRTRGRVFLPQPARNALTVLGRLGSAEAALVSDNTASYLTAFTADGVGMTSVVVSTTGQLLTPITEVSVGDVLDVQRRRRDDLVEVRTIAPVT